MQLLPAPGEVNPQTSSRIILSLDHVAQPGSSGCLSGKWEKKKKKGRKVKAGDAINAPGSSASVGLMSREGCSWFLHLLSPRELQ